MRNIHETTNHNLKRAAGAGALPMIFCSRLLCLVVLLSLAIPLNTVKASNGATVSWTTYEAENMTVNGAILGPYYTPNLPGSEASGRKYAQLSATGNYIQFTNRAAANALVVRYSVPDSSDGVGADYTLSLYTNGTYVGKLPLTSRYSWLYGAYPFTNYPPVGSPRNFFDEVRTNGLPLSPGDVVKLQKDPTDTTSPYLIDLVDLENVPAPLAQPANSLSIASYGAYGDGSHDDTSALTNCISAASSAGQSVWLPAGSYKISRNITIPANLTMQGAGMWHVTLIGEPSVYQHPANRVALLSNGSNIHLSDFAIMGKLNYRNDTEPNDGLVGSYGTGSTISRVWVEHTKTGAWIVNSQGLVVDGCRFRNTIADGINIAVGMRSTTVTNCTARGTGDDCFAIWPASYISPVYSPGLNVITHCTAQTPFLANGAAVYGGFANRIEDCLLQDITYGCGILLSTTFSVSATFSGTTVAQRSDVIRCGGYDPGYQWRAAVQLCMDRNNGISGANLNNLNISNSVSDGLSVIGNAGPLSNAVMDTVSIPNYGLGVGGRNGLWARSDTSGSLTVSNSAILQYRDDSPTFAFNFVNSLRILDILLNSDTSVTLTYATTPGSAYHVEASTNLWSSAWTTLPDSATNATGSITGFTDSVTSGSEQRYYRIVSP